VLHQNQSYAWFFEKYCNKLNAMHDFQKFAATKSRVCMISALKQGSKSCIPSDILQKTMHSLAFDAKANNNT